MRFFLLFFLVLFIAHPALAQDMLRMHREGDPMTQLLAKPGSAPETPADFANLYYESCITSNENESLREYVASQCSCTSVKMMEFMTVRDMQSLFTKTREGDFQQARVLTLAYVPCMETSVSNFVYDNCLYDRKTRRQLLRPRRTCGCYAKKMGNHVAVSGPNLIPGFTTGSFNSELSVANPFTYIIDSEAFKYASNVFFQNCMLHENFNLGKK